MIDTDRWIALSDGAKVPAWLAVSPSLEYRVVEIVSTPEGLMFVIVNGDGDIVPVDGGMFRVCMSDYGERYSRQSAETKLYAAQGRYDLMPKDPVDVRYGVVEPSAEED